MYFEDGAPAGGGTDLAPAPAPAGTPWYGTDAETKGYLDNRGWTDKPVAEVALEAIRAHRNAESHLGVPADRLLRLPADQNDAAGWKTVFTRLGAPESPDKYDFTGVQAEGEPPAKLIDLIRATADANHLSVTAAKDVATKVLGYVNGERTETAAQEQATFATQEAALKAAWGPNYDAFMLTAKTAAQKLLTGAGMKAEDVLAATNALNKTIGYDRTLEMFRQLGNRMGEDGFVRGSGSTEPETMTQEGAKARIKELEADKEWGKRLHGGDAATRREFEALTLIAAGGDDSAASRKPGY